MKTDLKGRELLRSPLYNRGTAFDLKDREIFQLQGLLPHHVSTIEEQVERRYKNFSGKSSPIEKYQFLSALQDRNEVLFYRLVYEHMQEMMPFVYTPTVGEASLDYSLHYNQSRGLYISYDHRHNLDDLFASINGEEIDIIVVTDGGRILGLGDQGVGGMTIPIGKLTLYTLFGGISPYRVLPILLDVGTNNSALLQDPLYLGVRHQRIDGDEYYEFLDTFVHTIKKTCPNALLQWEDFPGKHAHTIYKRYQDVLCSFNDDIQGTATVALAAILSAVKTAKRDIHDEKICILGGGAAGTGIASIIASFFQSEGLDPQLAYDHIYLVDLEGLIKPGFSRLTPQLEPFAKNERHLQSWKVRNSDRITLEEVIKNAKITTLIGVSTKGGAFNKSITKALMNNTDAPIIFPLSNPTALSEGDPKNLLKWTRGKAIIATGSPFPPVWCNGKRRVITQCNNVMVFPALGLAATAVRMKYIHTESFLIAAKTLSQYSPSIHDINQPLFPEFTDLRDVTKKIAVQIAQDAVKRGVAKAQVENIERHIEETMWFPEYSQLEEDSNASKSLS